MLIDSTLREGAQAYGVYFDAADRESILQGVAASGVTEAEAGWAGQDDLAAILRLGARVAPSLRLAVWCRCCTADLDKAAEAGARRVHIGVPSSDAHMRLRLGMGRDEVLQRVTTVLEHAAYLGFLHVTLGLEDAGRAAPDLLEALARTAARAGAHRLRCSDTVGLLTPDGMVRLVLLARRASALPVAVHCHNDLGLATANALAALDAGADGADVSLLGLGERAGITRAEELAAALVVLRGESYRLDMLRGVCRRLAASLEMRLPPHWAVAGENLFAVESGVHLHGVQRDPALFEPFPPALVGAERRLGVGGKCGSAGVAAMAHSHGLTLQGDALRRHVRAVRDKACSLGRPLTDAEFLCAGR